METKDIPSNFFKGLQEDRQSQSTVKNVTMLQCLRWVMKKHKMNIEIKRDESFVGFSIIIRLVNKNGAMFETDITDRRIEGGFFELELALLKHAEQKPSEGLKTILDLMQKNKLVLPPHNDLRNEIILNGHVIRISYMGPDLDFGNDLFSGFLFLNDEIVARAESQKRMGYVLDSLENALLQKKREDYRKNMYEIMNNAVGNKE